MRVLIVRHAQSANNIVQAQVHTKLAAGALTQEQAQNEWLANRMDDPELSSDGEMQTKALEIYAAKLAKKNPNCQFKIYSSPMTRACQTAQAVSRGIPNATVQLDPDLCEVGGIYSAQKVNGKFQKLPGSCPPAEQLCRRFPGFNSGSCRRTMSHVTWELAAPSGPWDGGKGFEQSSDAVKRAAKISTWLKTKAASEVGENGIVVIVSHADFIALLIAALCNVQVNSKASDVSPDMDMSAHGVSEGTLDDEIEQHCSSVYVRFRVSLACTTMIEVSNQKASVLWMNKKKHLNPKNCAVM